MTRVAAPVFVIVALVIALVSARQVTITAQQARSPTQEAVSKAIARASTPADCVTAVRDFRDARLKELQRTTPKGQQRLTAQEEKSAFAKQCAARFDARAVVITALGGLVELYLEADQPEQARSALDRGLAATDLLPAVRAGLLVQAIRFGLSDPNAEGRDARIEKLVDEVGALSPAVPGRAIEAHVEARKYYWHYEITAGVIKHSTWIVAAGEALTANERKEFGWDVVRSHIDLAQAWASQGRTAEALALLRRAKIEWGDLPDTTADVDSEIERLELVGTVAPPLTAPRWLNMPAGTTELDLKGSVTLLEFSAWWCKPCADTYPILRRLRQRYGAQGLRVVIATRLFGYFEGGEGMPGHTLPEATEIERDRAYFARQGLDVPIVIAGHTTVVNGTPKFGRDENYERYRVGGIPQIQLIDRQGKIRLIPDFSFAGEEGLAKNIEALIREAVIK